MQANVAVEPERIAHRVCPLCEACCGLELKVRGEQVISVRGHAADVFSAGYVCPKGASLKDLHEDPDRLRHPLIKRNGRFEEATWREAYEEIARRLPAVRAEHGRHAVGVVVGNPSAHKMGMLLYVGRLIKALGTQNFFSASTLDQMPRQLSAGLMFGHWLSFPVPDIERTDCLMILGGNPMVSNGSMWTVPDFRGKAKALRARGGRLIVIDPRRTETAAIADEHHFIRPGSDVFLLLGMLHTLFDEGLVAPGSMAQYVNGVDALAQAVKPYSPARVADRCGVAAPDIQALARTLATTKRAAIYGRMGVSIQEYGTLANWLIDVLNVLTGHLDQEGGVMFAKAAAFAANTLGPSRVGRGVTTGRRHSRVSGAPEVFGEFPINCLAEEIETPGVATGPDGVGQVRALITVCANPVLSAPNGPRLAKAFEALEFMVSVDIYLNETTRHADVILPGCSPLQDAHYDVPFPQFSYRNQARYSPALFSKDPGQPDEWEVLLKLGALAEGKGADVDATAIDDDLFADDLRKLLGKEHAGQFDAAMALLERWQGPERLVDLALRTGPYGDLFGARPEGLNLAKVAAQPAGVDLGPLAPRMPEVLRTPSGKVELAPALCLGDLERVRADLDRPVPDLVIMGRRDVRSGNSWMHNLPVLAKGKDRCTALVHPRDAQRLRLLDGQAATIHGADHTIRALVHVSDEVMPGVVCLPHGWGHDQPGTRMAVAAQRPGANLNAVLGDRLRDPLSGNAVLTGVPVVMAPA